jgi:repressor LexA
MARPVSLDLTMQQLRVARAVANFFRQGRPAFVSDLVKTLKLAAEGSLTPTLKKMQRNGFIEIQGGGVPGRSRLIQLTTKGRHVLGIGGLPLLGSIPAGPLSEAVIQTDEIVELNQLLPSQKGDFLLRVRGDSMIGDGILDGDLVLLRPGLDVSNGAIAAVGVGEAHEATLKRVFFVKNEIRLKASNPVYRDLVVPAADVRFYGVMKGVIRNVIQR